MVSVILSLGTNLPPKDFYLNEMIKALVPLLEDIQASSIYSTAPVGVSSSHDWYLNQLILGSWSGSAQNLLKETQEIESTLGRTDKGKLAPRTADIDILLFGDSSYNTPGLIIPHHALLDRRFHIEGLKELVPHWIVPGKNISFEAYTMGEEIVSQVVELYI